MALPDDARVSHLTRLQRLGLNYGPQFPLHFTRTGELHRNIDGIMLHRTIALPPGDAESVCVEAAYIGFAVDARTIDLVKIGDWLLRHGHLSLSLLRELAELEPWRPGAADVCSVIAELDGRSASLAESELRVMFAAAGLPTPEPNRDIYDGEVLIARVDLLFVLWRLIIEYEGRQHLHDIGQWNRDLGRYEALRDLGYPYLQVTNEMLRQPRALVLRVHRKLVGLGYKGPPPHFGGRWRRLFGRPRVGTRFES